MHPKKSHLSQLEPAVMSAFRTQPDWYEEYWLRPKKAYSSTGGRWRRSNLSLRSILHAATILMFVYFGH